MRRLDLEGQKYGRLTVLSKYGKHGEKVTWMCVCDCGNTTIVTTTALRSGNTMSCGCFLKEKITKHGLCDSKLYKAWNNMISRCYCESVKNYGNYGGRGIKVCDEWRNSFGAFGKWAMANGYQEHLTIDRIDVNGNYEPSNCRWITNKAQQNNKRNSRLISYNGETHTIQEWSEITGIHPKAIAYRIDHGWTVEKTLTKGVS